MSQENSPRYAIASFLKGSGPPKSLHDAAELGSFRYTKLFCEYDDFEPNKKDRYGRTALHWAAEHGHKEVAELLIDYGADVDCRDLHCLRTPLHWASKYGHFNIVKHLLRKGADVNAEDKFGIRPVFLAMQRGTVNEDTQKILLNMGAVYTQNIILPKNDPADSQQVQE